MKRNNNSIWGFIRKEFFHIFRDRKTLLLIFGMPVAQLLLFGFVVTNEIKDAKIAVYDQSKDYLSLQLVNKWYRRATLSYQITQATHRK